MFPDLSDLALKIRGFTKRHITYNTLYLII